MPLNDDKTKLDKNYDRISDYFNRIISRQNTRYAERAKNVDKGNDSFNRNKDLNRSTDSINKNKNQNFNEYFSRYVNQINNSRNSVGAGKTQERNDVNFDKSTDSRYGNTNLNNRFAETKTETNEKISSGIHDFEGSASDALLDRNLLRVMLPIKVTQQMCPDSHLIAYFYHNGEFVSASKHFEMDDCFVNKVDLTWQNRQVLPGSITTLQISTPGPALCALTVLDSASKWTPLASVKDVLINGLRNMMEAHRNLTEYDTAGDCFMNVDSPEMPTDSLELTAAWLASAGVRTVGDVPLKRQCYPAALTMERTVPRSDFSESWLWRLVTVGANGSTMTSAKAPDSITRFEANAVCLTKMGVSVAQPAVLQVLREFFIHADSPRRLRRGDTTIVRYRLFNYLYEPLSVQIQILTDPHLQGPSDLVESVCVPPRASTARRGEITATGQGEGRVIIRAKSVSDGGCGNKTNGKGVSDEVIIRITVEPEGVPVHEQKSILLCGKDSRNSLTGKSEVSWSWSPVDAVPGTESLTVWAIGNITGPLLADSDSLVLLPRGCGEQNMARLATNLLALSHLHPSCAAAASAREHVARGYNRQLQYVHPSGGFSAFGSSDPTASTWLTAFALRYLRRAHQTLWPGLPIPPAIEKAERWLLGQQMENGCFRNEGQVFHRELRGGLNEEGEIASVALTAYVITSLIESTSPLPARVVINTLACLRALPPLKYNTPTRIYAHSLLAYAFMRLKRYEEEIRGSNEASWLMESLKVNEGLVEVMELVKMGKKDGDFLWWDTNSLSTSIEATSYALLALRSSPSAVQEFGAGAVRWLAAHRAASGGFLSTQDTLVALEALSAWSSLQQTPVNLTMTTTSVSKTLNVYLKPGMMIPEVLKIEGDGVKVKVEGTGCALIQATRSYNTLSVQSAENKQLSVQLTVHTDGEFDCDGSGNCFCAAVIEACVVWSGLFPEMALLEVTLPGGYEADAKRLYSQLHQPDSLIRRIEVSASSSRATFYLSGAGGGAVTSRARHACTALHAVGPRARTKPAHARLYDYYRTSVNDTQIYTIPEDCPARVSHDTTQEIKDNIFSKARSLSDSSEILINQEFDFEDIPEGISLEDTLYDNLTQRKDNANHLRAEQENTSKIDKTIPTVNNEFDTVNKEQKIVSEYNEIAVSSNRSQNAGSNLVVIDDKLDLRGIKNQETKEYKNIEIEAKGGNVGVNTDSVIRINENENSEDEGRIVNKESNHNNGVDININQQQANTDGKIEEQGTANNVVLIEPTNHRIEIRDDQHDSHKVDNPNLSDFHVIDLEKDLEVPSGIEGPVPAVVLPPSNFVPPPNYVRAPDNFNSNTYAANYENFNPNTRIQNAESQNMDSPQRFAPEESYGWPSYNNGYHYGIPYRRNFRSSFVT